MSALLPWSTPASNALGVRSERLLDNRVVATLELTDACADASCARIDPVAALFLADHCMGMVLRAGHGWDIPVLTIELRVDWARTFDGVETLHCEGELVAAAGRCALLRATLTDGHGAVVAITSGQFLLGQFAGGAVKASANLELGAERLETGAASFREFVGCRVSHERGGIVVEPTWQLLGVVDPPVWHGGIVASALAMASVAQLPSRDWRMLGCTIQYLRPAKGGVRLALAAHANLLGRTISAFDARLVDPLGAQRPLATASATFIREAEGAIIKDA